MTDQMYQMKEILVQLREPTDMGRMYYTRSYKDQLIYIKSHIPRQMEYAISVGDGPIILMFDKNRILINVEFNYPRHAWKIESPYELPNPSLSADIEFTKIQSKSGKVLSPHIVKHGHSFKHYVVNDMDLSVYTNEQYQYAKILFDTQQTEATWVELSDHCLTLVSNNCLKGFYINLTKNINSVT